MWRESQFRRLFHATHEEYLAEPRQAVSWMLAMSGVVAEPKDLA